MKNLKFKNLCIVFFIIGLFSSAKPCYYYIRYNIILYLLNNSWETYQNHGYKKYSWIKINPIGKMVIPSINIENIILEGANENSLKYGLGRVISSANLHDNNNNIVQILLDEHD